MSNKKIFKLTVFLFSAFALMCVFAADSFAREEKLAASVTFKVSPSSITVDHSKIDRVSVNMRTLVAVGSVALEAGTTLKAAQDAVFLEYYTDADPAVKKIHVPAITKIASGMCARTFCAA